MENKVLSISQINEYIRSMMDTDALLGSVAVRGEISNYKVYPSGHHYFTLKDEGGALKCVMFKGNAMRLRFRPENGMKVIAMGKISVYPRDGQYQLYVESMVPDGVGELHIAYEQLKQKLEQKGLKKAKGFIADFKQFATKLMTFSLKSCKIFSIRYLKLSLKFCFSYLF